MNRNAVCPCGSGKRFKHCCGRNAAGLGGARFEALSAHQAGALGRAETLYRRALEENPRDIDALHMLGVVQMQRLRYREALQLLWDAAEGSGWAIPQMRHNMGLLLGKLAARQANQRQADLLAQSVALESARSAAKTDSSPLVSIVLPAYNHAPYVAQSLTSVSAQTYPHIELVVIDDGSRDGTATIVSGCLSLTSFPFPSRFVARENRGAPATLNEGASLARGQYLAFLNSDDYYAPDRIATMVEEIARRGAPWGILAGLDRCSDHAAKLAGPGPPPEATELPRYATDQLHARRVQRRHLQRQPVRRARLLPYARRLSRLSLQP